MRRRKRPLFETSDGETRETELLEARTRRPKVDPETRPKRMLPKSMTKIAYEDEITSLKEKVTELTDAMKDRSTGAAVVEALKKQLEELSMSQAQAEAEAEVAEQKRQDAEKDAAKQHAEDKKLLEKLLAEQRKGFKVCFSRLAPSRPPALPPTRPLVAPPAAVAAVGGRRAAAATRALGRGRASGERGALELRCSASGARCAERAHLSCGCRSQTLNPADRSW